MLVLVQVLVAMAMAIAMAIAMVIKPCPVHFRKRLCSRNPTGKTTKALPWKVFFKLQAQKAASFQLYMVCAINITYLFIRSYYGSIYKRYVNILLSTDRQHLVSSVDRAPYCRSGNRGFDSRPHHQAAVLFRIGKIMLPVLNASSQSDRSGHWRPRFSSPTPRHTKFVGGVKEPISLTVRKE